jgi:hypothetical protein
MEVYPDGAKSSHILDKETIAHPDRFAQPATGENNRHGFTGAGKHEIKNRQQILPATGSGIPGKKNSIPKTDIFGIADDSGSETSQLCLCGCPGA